MTNDDRNDQDRTGDGQAPRWGDAPQQQPDAEAPRYGERVDPAPTSTPQYGEQYGQGQQQYGQQSGQGQQYGQPNGEQQYGQPSSTPSWNDQQRHDQHHDQQPYAAAPAHAGAPAWQSHDEPKPKKKKTVGIIAFVLGLLALVLGVVGGYIMGSAISNSGVLDQITQNGSTNLTPEQMQSEVMSDPDVRSQLVGGIAVIGIAAFLGLWALVQGIIAAVAKRGRVWGILAIILAVVATIATFVTYAGVAAAAVAANS
ncbi:DUF4064 domain-containing protein [Curtobacterium flaccumfaciens pv. flaccumfaciens]|uniref:DUF4064 domain-containing protein n=1 Tax=Curtobacterium flaccumfaciens TaxID=2035 RepID=UPI001ADC62EA|nr:DUF4064 domain-containing protein [Curtobacterium flaccumfaciens]MBO9046265.1 DUF4064 domain-containing protein [Curtobacterium flaccumfaciens pv. flaccumfaciens]QTR90594.1 DUF4064 domain-containing protein [Curtobacterium flaccumfaciens pv. flaccumfaciens]